MILEEETFEKFGYYPRDLKAKSNKKILATCDDCGKVRITSKKDYYSLCRSCGRKGERSSSWKGGKVKRICQSCGKVFPVKPSEIKDGNGRFCSLRCSRMSQKFPKHHTKPELIFETICKKYNLPYKYTGDGSFGISKNPGINPDFVEVNGKKIAIEIFSYWHDPLRRLGKVRYSHTLKGRKKILRKYGWTLVVFWQEDLEGEKPEQFVLRELRKEKIVAEAINGKESECFLSMH